MSSVYLGCAFLMPHADYEKPLRTVVVQATDHHLIVRNEFGVRYKLPIEIATSGCKEREKSPEDRARDAADLRELLTKGKRGINADEKPTPNL